MADVLAGIHGAADRIRETAKWLTVSLATVGGVLIAGSQLSSLGKLQPSSSRFMVAVIGGSLAAAAAVTILAFAIWVATTPRVSLPTLVTRPPAGLNDTLTDPRFLNGRDKIEELNSAFIAALRARKEAFAALKHEPSEQNNLRFRIADAEVVSLSSAVDSLLAVVMYMRLAYRWRRAGGALLVCGILAAAGIGAFAWAANPPDNVKASMATPSVLTTPETVSVVLTAQGQQALSNALGPHCPVTSALRALSLGSTIAGPDVLIQQKGCNTTRFVAVANWASVEKG
jgi:nicotinamide riboside transporter PnuC